MFALEVEGAAAIEIDLKGNALGGDCLSMRTSFERAVVARRRRAAGAEGAKEEWGPLLEILRSADSPVGAAIHWVESQRGGFFNGGIYSGGGKRSKGCGDLWRFVPDLLATQVVYVEEEEEEAGVGTDEEARTRPTGRVGNCVWMQTLPAAMQTNILTFLNVEHQHFQAKDLESLARSILSSPTDPDFWLLRAATTLLDTASYDLGATFSQLPKDKSAIVGMEEYDALPDWLDNHTEQHNAFFSFLRPGKSTVSTEQADDPPSQQQDVFFQANERSDSKARLDELVNLQGNAQDNRYGIEGARALNTMEEIVEDKPPGGNDDFRDEMIDGVTTIVNETDMTDDDHKSLSPTDDVAARELGHELFSKAVSLREALHSCQGEGLPEEVNFIRLTPKLPVVLSVVRTWEVDDEVTVLLVRSLLTEQDGYAWSTQLLQSIFLPKLLGLVKPASRMLITALVEGGKTHPRATMEAVIFPLICSETGASNVLCEVINRIVKDILSEEVNLSLCERMFTSWELKTQGSSSNVSWVWTEAMITVVHNLLSQKLNLDERTIAGLVSALAWAVTVYSTSLKFANLLLNFFTRYGPKLEQHREILYMVASGSKTFLTKSLLSKVAAI